MDIFSGRSLLSSAFMQKTCHDLLRDHVSIRSRNYDCLPESEVRKPIGSPLRFRTYNPYVNNFQSLSQRGKVATYFSPESGVRAGNGSSLPAWACGFEAA